MKTRRVLFLNTLIILGLAACAMGPAIGPSVKTPERSEGRQRTSLAPAPSASQSLVPTPLPAPSASPVVVAIAGDIAMDPTDAWYFNGGEGRPNAGRQKYTAELVAKINPDAVLTAGDGQYYDATYEKYLASYDLFWGRFKSITRPAVGDHDYDGDGYFRYFGAAAGDPSKGYYSYDLGAWHVVALNGVYDHVDVYEGSDQILWLRQDLEANRGKPILAYWHGALFSSGLHGSDPSYRTFWQVLYQYGAKIVVNGHDHVYERFAPQDPLGNADPKGIREFVSGLGGGLIYNFKTPLPNSEVRYNATFGVLRLGLDANGYDWQFLPEAGSSFTDSGRVTW